jgi:hypothetical protein
MPQAFHEQQKPKAIQLTTDWWAVFTALALAVLVRIGLIHKIPW